jgi:hypothetical protein
MTEALLIALAAIRKMSACIALLGSFTKPIQCLREARLISGLEDSEL